MQAFHILYMGSGEVTFCIGISDMNKKARGAFVISVPVGSLNKSLDFFFILFFCLLV